MYCHICKKEIEHESAHFCPQCGALLTDKEERQQIDVKPVDKLKPHENEEVKTTTNEVPLPVLEYSRSMKKNKQKFSLLWPIAIPLFSFILATGTGYYYYTYQQERNEQVEKYKEKAELVALNGNYTEAITTLNKAIALRPSYKELKDDETLINLAITYNTVISEIETLLKNQQLDDAEFQIEKLEKELETEDSPLFTPLLMRTEEKNVTLSVSKIKNEIDQLETVEQLGAKLQALSTLNTAETKEVHLLITSKIVNISSKEAEIQLNEKQFSNAESIIDKALHYVSEDPKLLAFKSRIQEEEAAFEEAEKNRIEQALEAAALEELNNQTAAVQIEDMTVNVDEYGDLYISGQVLNTATVAISSITLYYNIYDVNGNEIASDFTFVDSYYLEPGKKSNFYGFYYAVNQDVTVEITNATWELH